MGEILNELIDEIKNENENENEDMKFKILCDEIQKQENPKNHIIVESFLKDPNNFLIIQALDNFLILKRNFYEEGSGNKYYVEIRNDRVKVVNNINIIEVNKHKKILKEFIKIVLFYKGEI